MYLDCTQKVLSHCRDCSSHHAARDQRPSLSTTGDLVKEGRGIGAAAVLQARVVWRRVCRDPDAFTATMTALLASAALSTKRAQTAVTHLFVTVAFRFVRPPAIRAAKVPTPCCVHGFQGAVGTKWHDLPFRTSIIQHHSASFSQS